MKESRDTSNESTLGTDGSGSHEQPLRGSTKDIVAAKYKKMRQLSKNIDLSKTNEYYEINKRLIEEQFTKANEREKEIDNKIRVAYKDDSNKRLNFVKEQTRRSCNNIFSTVSLTKTIIKKAGTICLNNNLNNENCHYQPSSALSCFSDKKVNNKLNIDIRSLSKIDLNQTDSTTLIKYKNSKAFN